MRTVIFTLVFLPFYLLTVSVNAGPQPAAALTAQAVDRPLCAAASC